MRVWVRVKMGTEGPKMMRAGRIIVIVVYFSVLFQILTAQLFSLPSLYFPLSSYESLKTLTKQQ